MTTDEFLSSRFKVSEPYKRGEQKWWLNEYDNCGATYGLTLMKSTGTMYCLETYEDSGYSKPQTIAFLDESDVLRMAECMRPTNPNHRDNG
jgi:hypothetical protein